MSPLREAQVKALEATRSAYGCGSATCVKCYPVQYACEFCGEDYPLPIANGESYACPSCEWETNGEET